MKLFLIRTFILTGLNILYSDVFSQLIISGNITNEKQAPLSGVSITLHKKNQTSIVAFAISTPQGTFSIKYNFTSTDSFELKASLLGHSTEHIYFISGEKKEFNFSLSPQAITLKEVKVKTPPVWQRKDTINYNASEFKQQQDRVIGDIIKRLPGIEVSENGQIKYNGKPINKYYIEGLDLLEDRYGLANNNIPADAVEKVQILENHQPIRVLDSVSFSDRAALNIKLKNSTKMKLIGRTKLGIGAAPVLTEDEILGMLFKKKIQFINTYKYNNTGTDNTRDLTSQNFSEYINAVQNGAVKNDLVSLAQPNLPSISQKRYLFNNAHILSINQLVPLNPIYQLRLNASYVNDFQKQQSSTTTKFYLPADTINISEQNNYHANLNMLQTDFALIANTPNYYLKNNLKFQGTRSAETSRLITTNQINQQLKNPFFNIANDFKLLKTTSNYVKEYGSYIGYVSLPQSLNVLPGIYPEIVNNNFSYDELVQQASLKTFYTDNYLSFRKRKTKIAGQYKIGFNIQSQHLLTDLQTNNSGIKKSVADTFQNDLNWQRYRIYNENSWTYENSKWRISFTLPLTYNNIQYKDPLLKVDKTKSGFFINPNTSIMFQLTPKWNIAASAGYNNGFGDISSINSGYILKTYRNLSNNNAPLSQIKSRNVSATVTFRNPLKIVFFNSGISFSKNKSNLIYSQRFNGNLETLTAFLENNYTNRITVSGRYSKYIIDWKTSLGFNYSYSFGNQQQLQQSKLITFSNKNYTIGTTISTKLSSKVTDDYTANGMTYSSKSQVQSNSTAIIAANQNLSFNYYPSQKIIFRAAAEHYYLDNNISTSSNYLFADMSMRFTPKKSKIDYELNCQNLFNTKAFTTAILLNKVETVSEFQLRPRQALFKMSFSF